MTKVIWEKKEREPVSVALTGLESTEVIVGWSRQPLWTNHDTASGVIWRRRGYDLRLLSIQTDSTTLHPDQFCCFVFKPIDFRNQRRGRGDVGTWGHSLCSVLWSRDHVTRPSQSIDSASIFCSDEMVLKRGTIHGLSQPTCVNLLRVHFLVKWIFHAVGDQRSNADTAWCVFFNTSARSLTSGRLYSLLFVTHWEKNHIVTTTKCSKNVGLESLYINQL